MPTYAQVDFRCSNKKCEHNTTTLRKYVWSNSTDAVMCDCGSELELYYKEAPYYNVSLGKWNGMSSTERGKVLSARAKKHSLKDKDKYHQMNHRDYTP